MIVFLRFLSLTIIITIIIIMTISIIIIITSIITIIIIITVIVMFRFYACRRRVSFLSTPSTACIVSLYIYIYFYYLYYYMIIFSSVRRMDWASVFARKEERNRDARLGS